MTNVERVLGGYPQRLPVGVQGHEFIHFAPDDISDRRTNQNSIGGEGQNLISRTNGADGNFRTVRFENRAVG